MMGPHSVVDRKVHQTVPRPENGETTSSSHLPIETEFLHRINGTSIIFQATKLLRLSPSVYATSTSIFHRFYHRCSLIKYDVWSISLASVLLACKTEEEVRRIREIILVFVHVYRRMRLGAGSDDVRSSINSDKQKSSGIKLKFISIKRSPLLEEKPISLEEKQNILRYIRPLPQMGQLYREWEETIMEMENVILRELGFMLHWITESHPHVFLLYFIKVLNVKNHKVVGQIAWNYCNDSCRIDLCVRYSSELIACAAIYLACIEQDISLPMVPRPWWHAFVGGNNDDELSTICNAMLALGDYDCVEGYKWATEGYVVSLVEDGSFCDPGSYIWNAFD
uniref:Cyclin-like domain-containing protein n=1 Tax=Chaetoceros debilis TaxID=122233 RepID=A0A7S3V5W6_9STRA|mmetsp:Transcript_23788/g.36185  ORF Transcript_23788/g.36185 Transcript_23788/m.36185 type:complete len:338 (+) Transcript_23788:72-1085(+)